MDALQLLLRLAHVGSGALWVGMMAYNVFFLMPALDEIGPDAGKVMQALQRRRMMTIVPILAVTTLISGIWLLWRVSGGFAPIYFRSGMGLALAIGGLASIIGYALGMTLVRPAMLRMAALTQQMGSTRTDDERKSLGTEIQRIRARGGMLNKATAYLLLLALAAMAVARYV